MQARTRVAHGVFVVVIACVALWYSQLGNAGTTGMSVYLWAATFVGLAAIMLPSAGRLGVLVAFTVAHALLGYVSPSAFGLAMVVAVVSSGAAAVVHVSASVAGEWDRTLTPGWIIVAGTVAGLGIVATILATGA